MIYRYSEQAIGFAKARVVAFGAALLAVMILFLLFMNLLYGFSSEGFFPPFLLMITVFPVSAFISSLFRIQNLRIKKVDLEKDFVVLDSGYGSKTVPLSTIHFVTFYTNPTGVGFRTEFFSYTLVGYERMDEIVEYFRKNVPHARTEEIQRVLNINSPLEMALLGLLTSLGGLGLFALSFIGPIVGPPFLMATGVAILVWGPRSYGNFSKIIGWIALAVGLFKLFFSFHSS